MRLFEIRRGRKYDPPLTIIVRLQGLRGKTDLLVTCAKKNDKLDEIVEMALGLYRLKVLPHARLLLFFNFSDLVDWYMSMLIREMSATVGEVLTVSNSIDLLKMYLAFNCLMYGSFP